MSDSAGNRINSPIFEKMGDGSFGVVGAVFVAIVIPLLLSSMFMGKKKGKHKVKLVNDQWDGATTMAELFEESSRKHLQQRFTGMRKLISRDFVTANDGKIFEKLHLGEYKWETYGQIFERVCNFASGLIQFGHDPDTRIAIFSDTRAEWLIAFQGCFRQNITVVTIYASLGDRALIHSLNEAQVSTVICDSKLLKKVATVSSRLRTVKNVIYFEDENTEFSNISDWASSSLSEVEKLGKKGPVHARLPNKDEIAMIMYRSGNTGLPKGVMMTHANIIATAAAVMTVIPRIETSDVYLAYLPLAHIFELAAETVMISAGSSIGYGSSLTLMDTSNKIKEGTKGDASMLKPTLIASVPSILDRIRDSVTKKFEAKEGLMTKLFHIAYKRRLTAIEGSWFGAWGLEKLLWDAIYFNKIGSILGGRIRFILSGGAPLTGDTQQFINVCMGVPIGQGYGLTETCAGAAFSEAGCFTPDRRMPRSEVLFGGVGATSGYFQNDAKPKEVKEKWMRSLSTSDMDRFRPGGRLEIIDRKKDIVKLKHGEYISLGKVEAVLASSNYVDNIMLHADPFHSYCVALVVPLQHVLENWARNAGISYKDFAELCGKDEAVSEVHQSLSKVAKDEKLKFFEIPAKIMLVADPWTPESGLVTDSLRLKRKQLRIRFKDDLQNLYR